MRNLKTRCNAILPIKVSDTDAQQYSRSCSGFADRVGVLRGRGQASVFEQSVYDLRMLLSRITWGHSYTTDSNGGGPEHNFSVIPFLFQASMHHLDADSKTLERQRAVSLVTQFMQGHATPFLFHIEGASPPVISVEFVFYLVTVTLNVLSISQWREQKVDVVRSFVAYLLSSCSTKGKDTSKPLQLVYADVMPTVPAVTSTHALLSGLVDRGRLDDYDDDGGDDTLEWIGSRATLSAGIGAMALATSSSSSSSSSSSTAAPAETFDLSTHEGVWKFLKPSLVFMCTIDALHTAFKGDDAALSEEDWPAALKSRLETQQPKLVDSMRGVRQKVVEKFAKIDTLSDMLEELGVLQHVLEEASGVEEWAEQFLS